MTINMEEDESIEALKTSEGSSTQSLKIEEIKQIQKRKPSIELEYQSLNLDEQPEHNIMQIIPDSHDSTEIIPEQLAEFEDEATFSSTQIRDEESEPFEDTDEDLWSVGEEYFESMAQPEKIHGDWMKNMIHRHIESLILPEVRVYKPKEDIEEQPGKGYQSVQPPATDGENKSSRLTKETKSGKICIRCFYADFDEEKERQEDENIMRMIENRKTQKRPKSHIMIGGTMRYKHPPSPELKMAEEEDSIMEEIQHLRTERTRLAPVKTVKTLDTVCEVQFPCPGLGIARMSPMEIRKMRERLRDSLPRLSTRDIRRHTIPYTNAVCMDLEEDGYYESALYIQYLLSLNNKLRDDAEEGSLILRSPFLKDQPAFLNRLQDGLKEAEVARRKGQLYEESIAFLNMATFFMNKEDNWWWVSQDLFLMGIGVASNYRVDGGRLEAIARYIYSLLLKDNLHDTHEMKKQLQLARDLSIGKDWKADVELNRPQETIFEETNYLLYQALLDLAIENRDNDPHRAVRYCTQALRRANDTNKTEAEIHALYELGSSHQYANEFSQAVNVFNRHLEMCASIHDVDGQCAANLELAICHRSLGNTEETLRHLQQYMDIAIQEHLDEEVAAAHCYIGEFYLALGKTAEASEHMISSFTIYQNLNSVNNLERTRALAAIATGLEILPLMSKMLLNNVQNLRTLKLLVQWKDMHIPFWEKKDISRHSSRVFALQGEIEH